MAFIELNSRQCRACWKCVNECPNEVLGKVDFLWHRHARILRADACTGCLRCVRACDANAILRIVDRKGDRAKRSETPTRRWVVNVGLLLSGALAAFSGLLIQLAYHRRHPGQLTVAGDPIWGLGHSGWADVHRAAIVVMSALMAFHVRSHWAIFKKMIRARLAIKDRQMVVLTIVFVMTAATGYLPWLIGGLGGAPILRKGVVEVHDKLAIVLVVYLLLHVIKRFSWFFHRVGGTTRPNSNQSSLAREPGAPPSVSESSARGNRDLDAESSRS